MADSDFRSHADRLGEFFYILTRMPGMPAPGGEDERDWFTRCSDAICEGPGRAAALAASLEDGQEAAEALGMVSAWPGQQRGLAVSEAEGPVLCAARALLGLVLAVENPDAAESRLLDSMARWRLAHVLPPGPQPALGDHPVTNPRLSPALGALGLVAEDPAAGYAQLALLALARSLQATSTAVHVAVVFGGGEEGASGKLTLRVQPGGPAGLYPDPRRMAFFRANEEFAASLAEAWATSPLAIRSRCVLWEIADDGLPVDSISGGSLAAAFGVGLNELTRRTRLRSWLSPQHLDPRCAITGSLDRNGVLQPVGDYEPKLRAAQRKKWRLVVPKNDPEAAKHPDIKVKVSYAPDLRSAVRQSRSIRPRRYVITATVLIVVLASLTAVIHYRTQADRNALREVAAHVASEASRVVGADEPTGLLLAMASDSIAASAGEHTSAFADLADNVTSLVKIDRPARGEYEDSVISPDGSLALIRTTGGEIDLVSTLNGARLWSRAYPPGLQIAPGQVHLRSMAISSDDQEAAYGSSDGRVHLLRQDGQGGQQGQPSWREEWSAADPWKPNKAFFGDVNSPRVLSFRPDGRQLLTTGGEEIAVYGTSRLGPPLHLCGAPADPRGGLSTVTVLKSTGASQALLASGSQSGQQSVYLARLDSCSFKRLLALPPGVTVKGIYQPSTGGVQAIGTSGNSIVLYQQGHKPTTVATLRNMHGAQVSDTRDGPVVTASSDEGTFAYNPETGARILGFRAIGNAAATAETAVFVHGGIAEIHSVAAGSIGQVSNFYDPAITELAWAGNGDLVAGRYNGVVVIRHPASPVYPRGGPAPVALLPGSAGTVYSLAASSTAPLAAAVISVNSRLPGNPTKVLAWNVAHDSSLPLPTPRGYRADTVTFAGSVLLIGYRGGLVREFALSRGKWTLRAETTLAGSPVSMSAGPSGILYVLTAVSSRGQPTLRELDISAGDTIRETGSRLLPGPIYGGVQALADGGVIASTGDGNTEKFTSALQQDHPTARVNIGLTTGLAVIPRSDEVMIVGSTGTGVLRQSTLQELGSTAWQRAGDVTSAAADPAGPYFATYSFSRMRLSIWLVEPRTLQQEACSAIGANLTRAQWAQYIGPQVPYRQVCA
jgi:hypothetical protein